MPDSHIIPVYFTEGLTQNAVRKAVGQALTHYNKGIETELPGNPFKERNILSKQTLSYLYSSACVPNQLESARQSLIYEELFNFQKTIAERSLKT